MALTLNSTHGDALGEVLLENQEHNDDGHRCQGSTGHQQTISLGIATMQGESSTDYGLLMAGAALASVPIIIVFLIFQKYFTKGITMGAVKG